MSIAFAASLIALQGATIVGAPQADASGLAAEYGSGVCRISVFAAKDSEGRRNRAEFSRRLRDGNFAVRVTGAFMSGFRDKDMQTNYPLTVNFDTGPSAATRSGGYDHGGFREYIWGGWGPGAASDAAYQQLKDASSFTISIDGNEFGPFNWQGKGAIFNALESCAYDNS